MKGGYEHEEVPDDEDSVDELLPTEFLGKAWKGK